MKKKRTRTLMFQLVLCFALILISVLLLTATSWTMTMREARNSGELAALTDPYTRLYSDLNQLRDPRSGIVGLSDGGTGGPDGEALMKDIRSNADALVRRLNASGFERASVDFRNSLDDYQALYRQIVESYERKDYTQVNQGIEQLDQFERWLRGYLAQMGAAISARTGEMQAQSDLARARYYRMMLLLGSAIFFMCATTLVISARRFVSPIEELCRNVLAFRLSDSAEALKGKGVPCKPNSLQEIRTLATAIYSMEDTVLGQYAVEKRNEQLQQKLVNEAMRTAQMERRLQEARLKALQAQINPHFLYNTLNMIGQMSYIEGAERTTELIETFSDFFRYNVESFERDVTLREEIDSAKGYAALQGERFGDRIRYVFEADEAINDIRVPSLIIQPLVENAVSHGLWMRTGGGEVKVSVKAVGDGGFEIAVSDNGCGMDADALRTLRERAEERRGDDQSGHVSIGITNVISRMRLTFGPRFSYEMESAPERGFAVRLRVEGK